MTFNPFSCKMYTYTEEREKRKMARYTKKAVKMYSTDLVFSAAATADRINGGEYIKVTDFNPAKITNKLLVSQILNGEFEITEDDHTKGNLVRTHFKGLVFKVLKGDVLNEFDAQSLALASSDEMAENKTAFVSCLPSAFARAQVRRSVDDRLSDCERKYVGDVGSKVTLSVEIVKCFYSQNYGCHFISGITKDNLAMSFAYSKLPTFKLGDTVNLTGKVKAHRDGFVSQLNYTKIQ